MNKDILCIYYSRTGRTEQVMKEMAKALDCEIVEVRDRAHRGGAFGALRCGLDAMRRRTKAISHVYTRRPLWEYKLVILGTPVWAGRCASVMRAFLKRRGHELTAAAYVITHGSEEQYRAVFNQMDLYLLKPHVADVSLRPGSTGYVFWRDQFLKACADFAGADLREISENEGTKPEQPKAED